jgi:hypothetical protein
MANKHPKDNIGVGKGKGRPKGSLNKTTISVKQAIEAAAEGLGGTARLIAWASEEPANERIFWGSIYPKLLPLTLTGDPTQPLSILHGMDTRAASLIDKIRGGT